MTNISPDRVLTLDLRARKFGYVVFEGPRTLLDWGVRTHADETHSSLERRLKNLLSMFAPSTIVVRTAVERNRTTRRRIRLALHSLKVFAKRALITLFVIDESSLHGFFSKEAKVNKHDIAQMIADRFPELSWRLPPKRKPWQSEPTRQSIFDAASIGIFYFGHASRN
jgi:hypothetical protein